MRSRALAVALASLSLVLASCGGDPVVPVDATPDADQTDALDLDPPDTMITVAPEALTKVATSRFEFTSSEPGTFKCTLDTGVTAPCTSPVMLDELPDGAHTYTVVAVDTSNNEDATPAIHRWTIDTVAPDTTILQAPPAVDNSTSINITFEAPGETGATFNCGVDTVVLTPCTTPFTADGLNDGNHTFRVAATDGAGNADRSPAAVNWVIDSVSPDTTIDTGPSGTVAPTTATFTFSSPNAGANATYTCHLDTAPFGACVSPRTFVGLTDGPHTFEVRVTDAVGNSDPTPARRQWTIDATGPVSSITVRPDNPSSVLTPAFQFTANEAGATFECQIDGQVPYAMCASPFTAPALPGGPRTFRVRATDTVGNRGPEAIYEWTIDAGGPTISISAGPNGPVASTTATFTWNSNEPATFCYRFTGDAADTCTMALAGSGTVTRPGLMEGPQTFTVTGTDALGNAGPPTVRNFVVDTVGPPVTITAGPMNTVGSLSNSFTFTSTEAATFCYKVDTLGELCTATPALTATVTVNANDGAHTLDVVARDALANRTAVAATRAWTVDTIRPATVITVGPAQGSTVDSGDAMLTMTASESATICWRIGAGAETCSAAPALTFDAALAAVPDGVIVFTARSSDAIGFGPTVTRRWTIDTVRPTVAISAGPAQGATLGLAEATFTVTASETSTICWQFNAAAQRCSGAGVVTFGPAATALPEGANTFTVFAKDAIGDGPMVSRMWTIDTIRPTMSITAGPAANSTSGNSVTTFSISSTELATICWRFNGGAEACSAPGVMTVDAISLALPDGGSGFQVYGQDAIGVGAVLARSWTIDSVRPTVTITAGPANGSTLSSTNASFTLVSSERATLCWSFNGGAPVCTAAGQNTAVASAAGLPQGATTFSVTAADAVGAGVATARNWTIDTVRPTVSITAGPTEGQRLNAVDVMVSIASTEASTICSRIDGAVESCSAAGALSTDVMLAGLGQGQHALAIYARDAVGVGATLTRSFIVDSIRPTVTITAGPEEGAGRSSTTASFQVVSSESSTICWKFNGGAETCSAVGQVAATPSAVGLPQGVTTFDVRASDSAGFGATVTRTFTIDTVRPTVTITVGPAQNSISGSANTQFTVTATEAATFCWRINNGVPTCSLGGLMTTNVLTGNLANGGATFAVEARDLVGAGATVVRNWVIDTIRPTVTITTGPTQDELVDSASVDFLLHSTEASQICWTFDAGLETCAAPGQINVHAIKLALADGPHSITFRAQDGVGFGAAGTRSWTIDTHPPVVTISDPPAQNAQTTATDANFTITTDEPARICWHFDALADTCTAAPPPASNLVVMTSASKAGLAPGIHNLTVTANDILLHEKIEVRTWTVDLTAPTLTITGLPADNGSTTDHDFAVVLGTDEDSTICYRVDSALPGDFICNAPPATRNLSFNINGVANGSHTADLRATDLAGNVTLVSRHWSSTAGAPTVSSITPDNATSDVVESTTIVVTFNRAMDPATLTAKATLDAGACSGSIQVSTDNFATCVPLTGKAMSNGDKTVTFTPAPGLSFGITYKVRIKTTAQGATDNTPLGAEVTQAAGFTTRVSPVTGTGVVIAQVYGSGGLAGATYTNDFVVLHNRGIAPVDISAWSLQYQLENANTWAVNAIPAAQSIAAGGYYLVKLGSGGAVGVALPAFDTAPASPFDLAADKGKLALVNNSVQLAAGCPAAGAPLVDLIGWGASTMTCNEGAAPAPGVANGQPFLSVQRKAIGCVDDGNNSTDFVSAVAELRSTTSLTNVCRVVHNEGGDGHELDYCADTTASVTVAAGGNMTLVGEVYEASLTTGVAGASPKITAQVGYGLRNTNPEWQNGGWTFVPATFSADSGNNDVYSTIVVAPAVNPLQYSYTYRFSLDSGATWTYCDLAGAGANAALFFETTNLPPVTVN